MITAFQKQMRIYLILTITVEPAVQLVQALIRGTGFLTIQWMTRGAYILQTRGGMSIENNMNDDEKWITQALELLEALERDCHSLEMWRSLAKPVVDCVIKMRDEINHRNKVYTVEFNLLHARSNLVIMNKIRCKNCDRYVQNSAQHMWLFKKEMPKRRCIFCLYPC